MKRHKPEGLDVAINTLDILTEINNHCAFSTVDKPNQTHESLVTYDISCNEDFALHLKYHDWRTIFKFFRNHPSAMGSFATKYVNETLLEYDVQKKVRVRFSLMPQSYSHILEPNTTPISVRIEAIDRFIRAGYDVHINFSPVIVTDGWEMQYEELFKHVNTVVTNKDSVKAEVIFLTHNLQRHEYNLKNDPAAENLLWNPSIQEDKVSQYGGKNIRYKHDLKAQYIKEWTELHDQIIRWNTIRYIF